MNHLVKIHLLDTSGYFIPANGGYHTVAPGPSAFHASLLTDQHGSELEFLGSIHGLCLAWLGRAPLSFSPFHLLHLMYAGQLAAMTPAFLETFDPETSALVKGFRSLSDLQELTQEPWRSRLVHHFDISVCDDLAVSACFRFLTMPLLGFLSLCFLPISPKVPPKQNPGSPSWRWPSSPP